MANSDMTNRWKCWLSRKIIPTFLKILIKKGTPFQNSVKILVKMSQIYSHDLDWGPHLNNITLLKWLFILQINEGIKYIVIHKANFHYLNIAYHLLISLRLRFRRNFLSVLHLNLVSSPIKAGDVIGKGDGISK